MIYINEWFPNPAGNDDKGEFIELYNSSSHTISLDGWSLWTGGKSKKASLGGYRVAAQGYLVFNKPQTKLSLKNTDGGLWLYGPLGAILDGAEFTGAAPIGKSFSRIDYGTADVEHFAFVDPTPGAPNAKINNQVAVQEYPKNTPLNPRIGMFNFLWLLVSAAIVITAIWIYVIYKNENLSHLIFPKDTSSR